MSKETDLRAPLEKKPGDPRSAFAGRCSRMLRKKRGARLWRAEAHPARRQPPGTHGEGREGLGRGSGVPGHLPSSGRGSAEPAGAASPWAPPGARPRCPFPARRWAPQITELLRESAAEKNGRRGIKRKMQGSVRHREEGAGASRRASCSLLQLRCRCCPPVRCCLRSGRMPLSRN